MSVVDRADLSRRRARAGRIRQGIQSYIHTLGDVAAAYADRDWEHLGYKTWDEYVDGEFGASRLQLSPEHRQKAVQELRLAGLSQRAIGEALGVGQATVSRTLAAGHPDGSPDGSPTQITGVDGKTYPTPARRDPESTPPDPAIATPGEPAEPGEVAAVGEDIAVTSPAEPPAGPDATAVHFPDRPGLESDRKSNRRPLVDAFRDAAYDLVKSVERVERLALDDRFPRNAEQVGRTCRADLLRAGDLLAAVVDRVPNLTKEPTE